MTLADFLVAENQHGSSLPMYTMAEATRNTPNQLKHCHTCVMHQK